MTVVCRNPECSELDVVKPCAVTLYPGEDVWCGTCGTACEVTS